MNRAKTRAAMDVIRKYSLDSVGSPVGNGAKKAVKQDSVTSLATPTIVVDPYQPWDMTERERQLAEKYLNLIRGSQLQASNKVRF